MKKIALILAVAMLLGLTAFAVSCTTTPAESSEEPAPATSSEAPAPAESSEEPAPAESSEEPAPAESSEEPAPAESSEDEPEPAESSEEPEPAESPDEPGETSAADPSTVKTSTDVSRVSGTNYALNAKVKGVSINPSNPDYCADLTDGKAATVLSYDNNWFGLYYNEGRDSNTDEGEAKFVVDMGEIRSISVIRANFMLGSTSGIMAPESVKIEVSEDGKKFVSLGKQSVPEGKENDATIGWIGYSLEENVNAQYVRLTVKVRGVWTFLNEIEVY